LIWQHKDAMVGRLAEWFRELDHEPEERVLLGAAGVTMTFALKVARLEVARIVKAAGGHPPWLANEPPGRGGCKSGRRISFVEQDGSVTTYPSFAEAARRQGKIPIGLREWMTRHGNKSCKRI
jgi:hypothetical protein